MKIFKDLEIIKDILDWHPDVDIQKIIKIVKRGKNLLIGFLLVLTVTVTILFGFIKFHNNTVTSLKQDIDVLQNTAWVSNDIKDSLFRALESSGYLYYMIEEEAKIKIPKSANKEHIKYMFERAIETKIPISIMFRLVHTESRFDSSAVSPTGAFGYMQLMPSTYELYCDRYNITKYPRTVEKNIFIGTTFLSDMFKFWDKKSNADHKEIWAYALATYNIGIANVNDTTFLRRDVNNFVDFINR